MTDQDLNEAAFREFLAQNRPGAETLEETRARLDRRADTLPLPTDCEVAPAEIGGVACERLTPVGARPGKTLLYFHGGGYCVGSPRSHRFAAARLADGGACQAVLPEYRKTPEHPYPAAVEDAFAVYRALAGAGEAVVIGGDSAGGGLALALAVKARDAGLPAPAGLLLISPWADLAHEGTTYHLNAALDDASLEGLQAAAANYARGTDLHDPLLSPLYADLSGLTPLMIQVGGDEVLQTDSTRLAERAAQAKVDVTLRVYPRLVHNFALHTPVLAAARQAMAEAGAWVGARF